ncbi:MAG: UdgX family uracil-DNA binding protein [Pseudomonadota bacterium]
MIAAALADPHDFEAWRTCTRDLLQRCVEPDQIVWPDSHGPATSLFTEHGDAAGPGNGRPVRASSAFIELARSVILHSAPARLVALYRVAWRLQNQPRLMDDAADTGVLHLRAMARQVRRDIHKMRAFVRFRTVADPEGEQHYVAWFEPEHRIERHNARFFHDRFASQRWSILTPHLSVHWDGQAMSEGPGTCRSNAPGYDAMEELWLDYYRSTFNPARLKVGAMLKEMPRKYWQNLPEARQIPAMVAGARQRELAMIKTGVSLFDSPPPQSLAAVAEGAMACRRCPIGCNGTRAVPGEGPQQSSVMIVGEQPGDNEEAAGRPFVGPAGQVLNTHLEHAGIDRAQSYLTNAVKHFKFTPRGKRRLHQTPTAGEIDICRWWLDAERAIVRPRLIIALGASAGRAVTGRTPSIGRERGKLIPGADGAGIWLTAHPSYLLRLDGESRAREEERFAADLAAAARIAAA